MEHLSQYVRTGKLIRLERPYPGAEHLTGFVHALSDTLLVIQTFYDFYCDGYSIVRASDIRGFRSGDYERVFERLFEREGLLPQVGCADSLPLMSVRACLKHFEGTAQVIIVECESQDNSHDDKFYMGLVSEVEGANAWLMCLDGLGKWEDSEVSVDTDCITRIQFDSPYIWVLTKYFHAGRSRCAHGK